MKRILTLVGGFVGTIVAANLLAAVGLGVITTITGDTQIVETDLYTLLMYCSVFLLTILGFELFKKRLQLDMPTFVPQFRKLNLPMIVASFLVILALGVIIQPLLDLLPDVGMDMLYQMSNVGVLTILTLVVAAPILEEYVFRGVVQRTLVKASSPWVGILIAALIFGVIHGIPQQAANAMVIGILIGIVYYITDSLMTVVVIHFLNNGFSYLQMLYFGKEDPVKILFDTPASYTILYIVSFIIVVGFTLFSVGAIRKKRVSLSVGVKHTQEVE